MATTRSGVTIRQLQRIIFQASRLQSSASNSSSSGAPGGDQPCQTRNHATPAQPKQPIVTYSRSSRVKLAGSSNKLTDFATSNILGAKTNEDVMAVEAMTVGKVGFNRQFNTCIKGENVQQGLRKTLSQLHKKADASVCAGAFTDSVTCWLNKLTGSDLVVFDRALAEVHPTAEMQAQTATFSSVIDMISLFEKIGKKAEGQRFILVNIGSSADDIAKLKATCDLAEEYQSVVVACDPHGIILMRNIVGDFQDNLDILKKPLIIHSSFDSFIGQSSLSYVSGPKSFVKWFEQCQSESQKMVPAHTLTKVQKILSSSDQLAGRLCQSLFSNIQLKQKLREVGMQVQCDDVSLFIGVEDEKCLQCAKEELKNDGFHVGVTRKTNKLGLKINITPDHSAKDIQRLSCALERAFQLDEPTKHVMSATSGSGRVSLSTMNPTNAVMMEVSSVHRSEMGKSIVQDFDIAVPLQMSNHYSISAVNRDPDVGSKDTIFTDNSPVAPSSGVNSKCPDTDVLEYVFFAHLNPDQFKPDELY